MRLHAAARVERVRTSLFFLPMIAVVAAVAAGSAGIWADARLGQQSSDLPLVLSSTVDSARSILSTVAAATISFAGIAFSVALLVIQQTSSQYSPRVVQTLFRDPFNKRVMALVVGTFTFCIVVLRSVRGPLDSEGQGVIPNLSVAVAVVLGLSAILATVAFINHNAHSMDVSEILERTSRDAVSRIREVHPGPADEPHVPVPRRLDPSDRHLVRFEDSGWVLQIDLEALGDLVPDGGVIEVATSPGRFAIGGTVMCSVSGAVSDPDSLDRSIRATAVLGSSRSAEQDTSYGLRQLVDVGLRALSPGINDPTTAQDAIFHVSAVLVELLRCTPPSSVRIVGNGRLVLSEEPTPDELVRLAFEELRRSAASHPTVCVYLLEAIRLVREALVAGEGGRPGHGYGCRELEEQARLVLRGCSRADLLPEDLDTVRRAYHDRFEPPVRLADQAMSTTTAT